MFKNSIKNHLFIYLSSLITITLLIIALISFLVTKQEAEEVFDSNLVRTAKLLLSLTKHEIIEHETNDNFIIDLGLAEERSFHKYEYKIHFQIWKEEYLIYNSSSDIVITKPDKEGFRSLVINNKKWESFVIYDKESNVMVEVIEQKGIRVELIRKILATLFLPLLASFIPILIIIWFVVNKGLIKLTRLSNDIKNISPSLLTPFKNSEDLPSEVKPLINSLNSLLFKLEESMDKEREFINYASHEIRTPLSVIKTKTQFLIKKYNDNKSLNNDLGNLMDGINRIINLSNQLLTLSRIESETKILEKANLDLGKLLNQIIEHFKPIAKANHITIDTEIDGDYIINAHKYYIEIMFNNIIDNAIKYSPNQSSIKIKLIKNNSNIIFSISNKGNTLTKNDQEKIFERFYRTKDNTKSGSGLGLAIVKKILDLHESKISFTSKDQNNCVIINFQQLKI